MLNRKLFFLLMLSLLLTFASTLEAQQKFSIKHVKDQVYRFTAGHYHSIFVVDDAGILITDPINKDAAEWLKAQLKERFNKPIRYMVYSHNHIDHTYGGDVFDDPAITVVSHQLAREDLLWTKAPTRLPDLVFADEATIFLGKQKINLRYHGSNNGRGSISMLIEPSKVMFVVDWIVVGRMPFMDLKGYDIHGMIHSTREILKTDFDVFVGGHANIGNKQDVENYLKYIEALYQGVRDGMLAGKTLKEIQDELQLTEFNSLLMFKQWRALNIEGVYRIFNDASYFDMRPDIPKKP